MNKVNEVSVSDINNRTSEEEDLIIQDALNILHKRLSSRRMEELEYTPVLAGSFFQLRLGASEREIFTAMFMDNKHRLLFFEEIHFGTVGSSEVHPREIVKSALRYNASAVILGHNHPSGTTVPSDADIRITTRIKKALALVDVQLLDHFIIGEGEPLSLASEGLI